MSPAKKKQVGDTAAHALGNAECSHLAAGVRNGVVQGLETSEVMLGAPQTAGRSSTGMAVTARSSQGWTHTSLRSFLPQAHGKDGTKG